MPPPARLSDLAHCPNDVHAGADCPHAVTGPAVTGSPDVTINDRPALRVGDAGLHETCCGSKTWMAATGASTVLVNDRPVVRVGDATQHCGGQGHIISGAPDVDVGDAGASAAPTFVLAASVPSTQQSEPGIG